jgi:hypothetical protein
MARHYSPPGTFEAIRKEVIEDPTWTPAEFRLVIWLAAKRAGWVIHPKVLADGTGLSGRAVLAALTGLRRRDLVYDVPVRTPDGRLIDHWETRFRRERVVAAPPPPPSTPPETARVDPTSQNTANPLVASTPPETARVDPTRPNAAKPQVTSTEAVINPLEKRVPIEKTEKPVANTDLKPSDPPNPPGASGALTEGEPHVPYADNMTPLPFDIPAGAALVPVNGKAPALGSDQDPGFAAFWAAYPRKTAKGAARRAWAKAIRAGACPDVLVAAAARYRESPARTPDYTCHPATWLNQERWEDDLSTVAPARPATTNDMIRHGMSLVERYRQAEAAAR